MKTEDYFTYLVRAYSYYHPVSRSRRKARIFETLESMEKKAEELAENSEKAHVLLLKIRHLKTKTKLI